MFAGLIYLIFALLMALAVLMLHSCITSPLNEPPPGPGDPVKPYISQKNVQKKQQQMNAPRRSAKSTSGSEEAAPARKNSVKSANTEGARYYTRKDVPGTAVALNGSSSYFCSWNGCPGGLSCGVTIYGTEDGNQAVWQIPTKPDLSGKISTVFRIKPEGSGFTFIYKDNRAGTYVPVGSWAIATQGDQGYCRVGRKS